MQMSRLCFALKRSRNLCKVFNLIQHTRAGWLVGLLAVRRRSIMFFALGCDLRSAGHDLQKAIRGGDHSRWKLWPQPPAEKAPWPRSRREIIWACVFFIYVCARERAIFSLCGGRCCYFILLLGRSLPTLAATCEFRPAAWHSAKAQEISSSWTISLSCTRGGSQPASHPTNQPQVIHARTRRAHTQLVTRMLKLFRILRACLHKFVITMKTVESQRAAKDLSERAPRARRRRAFH